MLEKQLVGIDEVGRGSWAGPLLVVAARAKLTLPPGLADSKTLTRQQREVLIEQIIETCDIGEGWVQPEEIDKLGLTRAMRLGVGRALLSLGTKIEEDIIIIDGLINYCPEEFTNVRTVAKADSLHPIVSAASIYAKVTRDKHMSRIAKFHPFYGFEKHVGYGTALHLQALKVHGVSGIHRKSFAPIKKLLPGYL
jgi:ribonuclease HII